MNELVLKVSEKISDELKLHKQSLDWEDVDGPIQRTARDVLELVLGSQFTDTVCVESEDWDWWLKLAPEVKGRAVKAFRQAVDAELLSSRPAFLTPASAQITIVGNTPTTGGAT